MTYITFSGSCVKCITCSSRVNQGNIGKSLFCCRLPIWPISTSCMLISQRITFIPQWHDLYARFAALPINGVERNRSVCRHAQTVRRCRTRRMQSSIHTAAPTRRVPFASTENTSRCGLSLPDEPDAVDAVCTRATRRVPFANVTRVG